MALIPQEPRRRNAVLAGVLAIAGAYFFHSMWYTEQLEVLDEDQAHLELLEVRNLSAQSIAARGGRELEEQLSQYQRHVGQLETLIPRNDEVAALLVDMASEARRLGVELSNTQPGPEEPSEFYTKDTYEMTVVGEYHAVARFLTQIASLQRIVTPVDVQLSEFDDPSGNFPEMVSPVQATFVIETYVLPDTNNPTLVVEGPGG